MYIAHNGDLASASNTYSHTLQPSFHIIAIIKSTLASCFSRCVQRLPPSSFIVTPSISNARSEHIPSPPPDTPSPSSTSTDLSSSFTSNSSNISFFMNTPQTSIIETGSVKFHESHKAAPVLLPRCITPAIINQFQEYAIAFFTKAKTTEEGKVSSLLTSFHDPAINNWAKMNKDRFKAANFTFPLFMAELRKCFFDPLWENNISRSVVNAKMISMESFSTFANQVIVGNNLLDGSKLCLTVNQLRGILLSNMGDYLASKWDCLKLVEREHIEVIDSFNDWLLEIIAIDTQANKDLKRVSEMAAEDVAKRQRLNPSYDTPSSLYTPSFFQALAHNMGSGPNTGQYRPYGSGANTVTSLPLANCTGFHNNVPHNAISVPAFHQERCPKLRDSELKLLNDHKGC